MADNMPEWQEHARQKTIQKTLYLHNLEIMGSENRKLKNAPKKLDEDSRTYSCCFRRHQDIPDETYYRWMQVHGQMEQ